MTDNTITNSPEDFDWFKNNGIFMPMINDRGRNIAYKNAIERVAPGSIMCDIGTGTGLLSILAAKAGAKKVYSIEMDPGRAEYARGLIKKLGLDNIIQVINKNFYKLDRVDMPDDIDYFVSETIGSPIFNEDIIDLAKHSKQWGGTFIPGTIDLIVEIYNNHPILPLVYASSEAFEFQPDIDIDNDFENEVNTSFQTQHPSDSTIYRMNFIDNLFQQLPCFKADGIDLKFDVIHQADPVCIDLNDMSSDVNDIRIRIPNKDLPPHHREYVIVLKWQARMFDDIVMRVEDTIWGSPGKTILERCKRPGADLEIWYDPKIENWRLSY